MLGGGLLYVLELWSTRGDVLVTFYMSVIGDIESQVLSCYNC
jgi:hypothetical protein